VHQTFCSPKTYLFPDSLERMFGKLNKLSAQLIVLCGPHRSGKTSFLSFVVSRKAPTEEFCIPMTFDRLMKGVDTEKDFLVAWQKVLEQVGFDDMDQLQGLGIKEGLEVSAQAILKQKPSTKLVFLMDEFEHSHWLLPGTEDMLGELLIDFMVALPNAQFIVTGTNIISIFTLLSKTKSNIERTTLGLENAVTFADYRHMKEGAQTTDEDETADEYKMAKYKDRHFSFESFLGYPGHLALFHAGGIKGTHVC
jgi:AAA+ ATPase superfamily predicted ATPase